MQTIQTIIHWTAYGYYVYLFGYASLFKVFQKKAMIDNMEYFGFGKTWTLFIGYGELLGLIGLIIGLWYHQIKNASIIWLFLFAVGALMVHFAHGDYVNFYGALFGCSAAVVLLVTDTHFKVTL